MRVLLIEDDRYLADDLKFIIERRGHELTIYAEADEVMEKFQDLCQFETVVLDIMMMKGDLLQRERDEAELRETGEILFQRIRKEFPRKRVIILTAKSQGELAIDSEGLQVFTKPLTSDDIERLVQQL